MNLSSEEILSFKLLCQRVIEKPLMLEEQKHIKDGGKMWCVDWEIIELCKFFFNGETGYLGDPPPYRLRNNPLWNQPHIVSKAKELFARYDSCEKIINHLAECRSRGEWVN